MKDLLNTAGPKEQKTKRLTPPLGDYVSPGLQLVMLDDAFPNMILGTTLNSEWPYLRREIAHNWYVDKRNPTIGFVSRDEASILYNTALAFRGLPCLEVGCWRGWSTAHLALGSENLEVIDPVLRDTAFRDDLTDTLRRAGVLDRVVLHDGFSPAEIERISVETGKRWSLSFIDGDHEGDAPRRDAEMAAHFAAEDAVILFHDLASPHPAAALEYLRTQGWETWVYQTMQIIGVAVRGAIRPIEHVPDPAQLWALPAHLAHFPIIGERRSARLVRVLEFSEDKISPAQLPGAAAVDDLAEDAAGLIDALLSKIGALGYRIHCGRQDAEAASAFDALQRKHLDLIQKLTEVERERGESANERAAFDLLQRKHVDQMGKLARLQIERDEQVIRGEQLATELASLSHQRDVYWHRLENSIRELTGLERERDDLKRQNSDLAQLSVQPPVVDELRIRQFAFLMARKRMLFGLARRVVAGRQMEVRSIVEQTLRVYGMPDGTIVTVIDWLSAPRVILGLMRRRLMSGMYAVQGLVVFEMQQRIEASGLTGIALSPNALQLSNTARKLQQSLEVEARRFKDLEQRFRALEAAKLADEKVLLAVQIANAKLRGPVVPADDIRSPRRVLAEEPR